MRSVIIALSALLLICTLPDACPSEGPQSKKAYLGQMANDGPIIIDGDTSLLENATARGWVGNGSADHPVTISGLILDGASGSIDISSTTLHILIEGCYLTDGPGIILNDVRNVSVEGNRISGAEIGVLFGGSTRCKIERNLIDGTSIALNGSKITPTGVRCVDSTGCQILNNTILNINGTGIDLGGSDECAVTKNLVAWCEGYGIRLIDCRSNTVTLNSFQFNRKSTALFEMSKVQAFDQTGFNSWVTVSGKGNHWADHASPDIDLNGITDEPYGMDGSTVKDQFPLTRSPTFITTSPQNLSVKIGNGRVDLEWEEPSAVRDATVIKCFFLYRSESGSDRVPVAQTEWEHHSDTGLSNGQIYSYHVAAITNFGEGDPSGVVTAVPDGTGPTFKIDHPQDGSYINDSHVVIGIQTVDIADIHNMDIVADSVRIGNITIGSSVDIGLLSEGYHFVEVISYDIAMNPAQESVGFTIDTVLPNISIAEIPPYVKTDRIDIFLNASDENDLEKIWCEMDGDNVPISENGSAGISGLTEGSHTILAYASDPASNKASDSESFTVDLTEPYIEISDPAMGSVFDSSSVMLRTRSHDNISGVLKAEYRLDNGDWTQLADGYFQAGDGHHLLEVRIVDRANWTVSKAVEFDVSLDNHIPINGTVRGRVVDSDGDPIEGVRIEVDGEFNFTTGPNGSFSISVEKGVHRLTFYSSGRFAAQITLEVGPEMSFDGGEIVLSGEDVAAKYPSALLIGLASASGAALVFLLAVAYLATGRRRGADTWGEE